MLIRPEKAISRVKRNTLYRGRFGSAQSICILLAAAALASGCGFGMSGKVHHVESATSSKVTLPGNSDALTVGEIRHSALGYDKKQVRLEAVVVEESRDDAIGPSYLVLADNSVDYWASPQRANNDYKSETDCVLVSPKPQSIAPGDDVLVQGKYDTESNTITLPWIKDLGQHNSQAPGGQMALPDPGNNP